MQPPTLPVHLVRHAAGSGSPTSKTAHWTAATTAFRTATHQHVEDQHPDSQRCQQQHTAHASTYNDSTMNLAEGLSMYVNCCAPASGRPALPQPVVPAHTGAHQRINTRNPSTVKTEHSQADENFRSRTSTWKTSTPTASGASSSAHSKRLMPSRQPITATKK